jgi:hypothetical protein
MALESTNDEMVIISRETLMLIYNAFSIKIPNVLI